VRMKSPRGKSWCVCGRLLKIAAGDMAIVVRWGRLGTRLSAPGPTDADLCGYYETRYAGGHELR